MHRVRDGRINRVLAFARDQTDVAHARTAHQSLHCVCVCVCGGGGGGGDDAELGPNGSILMRETWCRQPPVQNGVSGDSSNLLGEITAGSGTNCCVKEERVIIIIMMASCDVVPTTIFSPSYTSDRRLFRELFTQLSLYFLSLASRNNALFHFSSRHDQLSPIFQLRETSLSQTSCMYGGEIYILPTMNPL